MLHNHAQNAKQPGPQFVFSMKQEGEKYLPFGNCDGDKVVRNLILPNYYFIT